MDVGAEVAGATALHGERDLFWGGLGDGVAEFILAGPTPGEYEDELVGEIDSFFEGGERRAFEVFFGFGGGLDLGGVFPIAEDVGGGGASR